MELNVSVVPCKEYSLKEALSALETALAPFGGLSWVKSGMKIVIKANLVMFKSPSAAATTHPILVEALSKMLTSRGAQVIIGDSPGGLFTLPYVSRIYSATGMTAIEKANDGVVLNRNFDVGQANYPEAMLLKQFQYTKYLDEADAIIDFCKLKTHGMMAFSGACKNMFGAIPGTRKPEYHYHYPKHSDFADILVDLAEYFKPTLCIADAVYGMEGNGPTAGTPRYIGALLASVNPHALDLAGAHLMGLSAAEVPTLSAAVKRGLIPSSTQELCIYGELENFVVSDYKTVPARKVTQIRSHGKLLNKTIETLLNHRPVLKYPDRCVGCGECFRTCPAKAITMVDKKPIINKETCIRCFCCQEFCPVGALAVHRSVIARMLSK
ncbi:MAG: DUF362 domain-containing protein [Clostridia bacterium]|nr:DUF362 domain-containing protein [Clostridia bacterium]